MIEVVELESTETPEFKEAVKIYETVFPPEQRVEPEYFISSLAGSMENVADPNEMCTAWPKMTPSCNVL